MMKIYYYQVDHFAFSPLIIIGSRPTSQQVLVAYYRTCIVKKERSTPSKATYQIPKSFRIFNKNTKIFYNFQRSISMVKRHKNDENPTKIPPIFERFFYTSPCFLPCCLLRNNKKKCTEELKN